MGTWRRRQMMAAAVPLVQEEYIVFADPVVEAICAQNWGDGIGITPSQAAAVTDLFIQNPPRFTDDTQIMAFPELIYFTNVNNISALIFRNCTGLASIGLPPSLTDIAMTSSPITSIFITDLDAFLRLRITNSDAAITAGTPANIGAHLYLNDTEITAVSFPNGATVITNALFAKMRYITQFTLPSTLESVGDYAFRWSGIAGDVVLPASLTYCGNFSFESCENLRSVTVLATTPPGGGRIDRYANFPVYVPYSADHSIIAAYKAASGWSTLSSRIYELNPDGTIPS